MKGQDNRKYAIYSRKSKFTGKGESIENQIELCRQHIKLHHDNVTEEDILKAYDTGNLDALPDDVRKYFDEL